MTTSFTASALVPTLLALQFVVFGWRISREIAVGDDNRRTWLLFSDYLNFFALNCVMIFCVIIPLHTGIFDRTSRAVLAGGYVLICATPLMIAGHYRLFSKYGRSIYKGDVPRMTDQEIALGAIALLATAATAYYILNG